VKCGLQVRFMGLAVLAHPTGRSETADELIGVEDALSPALE
jgi:hypothetical protein